MAKKKQISEEVMNILELPMDAKDIEVVQRSELATLKHCHGIPIHYARFHSPVPPCKRLEPVSEFRIKSEEKIAPLSQKYLVDSLLWIPGKCLIWTHSGEEYAVESANIMYTRISM